MHTARLLTIRGVSGYAHVCVRVCVSMGLPRGVCVQGVSASGSGSVHTSQPRDTPADPEADTPQTQRQTLSDPEAKL